MAGPKLGNILRHANVGKHLEALQLWNDPAACRKEKDLACQGQGRQDLRPYALSYSHILFQRTLIQTGGSFSDSERWAATARLAGLEDFNSMTSREVASNLTSVMSEVEADITSKLASACASLGLIIDGRQQVLGICLRGVLWVWPRGSCPSRLCRCRVLFDSIDMH